MAFICESCDALNPATNRYCGQCGTKLERIPTDPPEEFWRDPEGRNQLGRIEVSADLPPEVIAFDNQVPLIAVEGTDRRRHPPLEVVEQANVHLEREAELHDYLRHGGETHIEASAKQESEDDTRMAILRWKEAELESRGIFLPWNIKNEANDAASVADNPTAGAVMEADPEPNAPDNSAVTNSAIANAVMDSAAEPGAAQLPEDRSLRVEDEKNVHTGESGPSFLGLTENYVPRYDFEEGEPESHSRRNIALAVLVAALILAVLQWRAIRDYGLAYLHNGTGMLVAKLSDKPIPATYPPENDSSRVPAPAPPPATAQPVIPRTVVNSPNAGHKGPVQRAARLSKPRKTASASSAALRQPSAKSAPAHAAPAVDVPKAEPSTTASLAAGKSRTYLPSASDSTEPAPGADEMNRAAHTADDELRAAWLWRAVSKGNPEAPVELARLYERGSGVARSCDQAEVLLRSAAAKGNEQAKFDLQQIQRRGGCSAR